ncbi:hypothetical protein [Flavobacterium sp.]|uniref:hypothetical protein n=1 Tax=Flavobacterium sp. TaxID=239 RepID=UPI002ED87C52
MKRIIIIALICLSSCISYQKFDYNKDNNSWIRAFQDNVFLWSLKESGQNDSIFQMERKNLYNSYGVLSLDEMNETRRLAKDFVKTIPKPLICENCKEDEYYYLKNCLHYYASCELEFIAKEAYKKHLSMQTESLAK